MLDHIILSVSDVKRATAFYEKALAPLGIRHFTDYEGKNGHVLDPDGYSIEVVHKS